MDDQLIKNQENPTSEKVKEVHGAGALAIFMLLLGIFTGYFSFIGAAFGIRNLWFFSPSIMLIAASVGLFARKRWPIYLITLSGLLFCFLFLESFLVNSVRTLTDPNIFIANKILAFLINAGILAITIFIIARLFRLYKRKTQETGLLVKPSLAGKDISFGFLLLIADIGLFASAIKENLHALFGNNEFGSGILIVFLSSILSILGFIYALNLVQTRKVHLISILFVIISFFCLPIPGGLASSYLSQKYVDKIRAPELEKEKAQMAQREQTLDQERKAIYQQMLETFQMPQEVVGAEVEGAGYSVMALRDGNIIALPDTDYSSCGNKEECLAMQNKHDDFIKWINQNLPNKQVKIVLPQNYTNSVGADFGIVPCENGIPVLVSGARKDFNLQEDVGYCSVIQPEKIIYNNQDLVATHLK